MVMTAARFCLAALLALSLVISGQAIAQAKGASPATGQLVICTGAGAVTVFTDADGNPTAPPHLCPDCILGALAGPPTEPAALPARTLTATRLVWPVPEQVFANPGLATAQARAPPLSV
jgi:hypothetical protein